MKGSRPESRLSEDTPRTSKEGSMQIRKALVLGMALAFNGASLFTVAASCCAVVLIAEWILL